MCNKFTELPLISFFSVTSIDAIKKLYNLISMISNGLGNLNQLSPPLIIIINYYNVIFNYNILQVLLDYE